MYVSQAIFVLLINIIGLLLKQLFIILRTMFLSLFHYLDINAVCNFTYIDQLSEIIKKGYTQRSTIKGKIIILSSFIITIFLSFIPTIFSIIYGLTISSPIPLSVNNCNFSNSINEILKISKEYISFDDEFNKKEYCFISDEYLKYFQELNPVYTNFGNYEYDSMKFLSPRDYFGIFWGTNTSKYIYVTDIFLEYDTTVVNKSDGFNFEKAITIPRDITVGKVEYYYGDEFTGEEERMIVTGEEERMIVTGANGVNNIYPQDGITQNSASYSFSWSLFEIDLNYYIEISDIKYFKMVSKGKTDYCLNMTKIIFNDNFFDSACDIIKTDNPNSNDTIIVIANKTIDNIVEYNVIMRSIISESPTYYVSKITKSLWNITELTNKKSINYNLLNSLKGIQIIINQTQYSGTDLPFYFDEYWIDFIYPKSEINVHSREILIKVLPNLLKDFSLNDIYLYQKMAFYIPTNLVISIFVISGIIISCNEIFKMIGNNSYYTFFCKPLWNIILNSFLIEDKIKVIDLIILDKKSRFVVILDDEIILKRNINLDTPNTPLIER